MRLLAACCEHPFTPEAGERVDNLVREIDEWAAFRALVTRHQVTGFVADKLGSHSAVPAAIRKRLHDNARQVAVFNLRQAEATGRLHRLLRDAGVPNLVLKGLPFAIKTYNCLTLKRSVDIDLLVHEKDAKRAIRALGEAGFCSSWGDDRVSSLQLRAVMRHHKEISLADGRGTAVDLHWRLVDDRRFFAGTDPFANASSVRFDNLGEIAILGEADEFAYLCMHGALSEWSRLKWLVDVNAMLGGRSDEKLLALHSHADRLGGGNSVLQALALRQVFWGHRVPEGLQQRIERIDCGDFLDLPIDCMTQPYRPDSPWRTAQIAVRRAQVRSVLYGSSGRAWRELGSHFYALPDLLAFPLPRALDWLYPVLRPALWIFRRIRGKGNA